MTYKNKQQFYRRFIAQTTANSRKQTVCGRATMKTAADIGADWPIDRRLTVNAHHSDIHLVSLAETPTNEKKTHKCKSTTVFSSRHDRRWHTTDTRFSAPINFARLELDGSMEPFPILRNHRYLTKHRPIIALSLILRVCHVPDLHPEPYAVQLMGSILVTVNAWLMH